MLRGEAEAAGDVGRLGTVGGRAAGCEVVVEDHDVLARHELCSQTGSVLVNGSATSSEDEKGERE